MDQHSLLEKESFRKSFQSFEINILFHYNLHGQAYSGEYYATT